MGLLTGVLYGCLAVYLGGWYLGRWTGNFSLLLFILSAVTLLYSPWGLAAAITAHVFGDVLPLVFLRRQLRAAHKARRLALRARSS